MMLPFLMINRCPVVTAVPLTKTPRSSDGQCSYGEQNGGDEEGHADPKGAELQPPLECTRKHGPADDETSVRNGGDARVQQAEVPGVDHGGEEAACGDGEGKAQGDEDLTRHEGPGLGGEEDEEGAADEGDAAYHGDVLVRLWLAEAALLYKEVGETGEDGEEDDEVDAGTEGEEVGGLELI